MLGYRHLCTKPSFSSARSGRSLEETEGLRVENSNCKEVLNEITVARISVRRELPGAEIED
jgi:hypothetical protein